MYSLNNKQILNKYLYFLSIRGSESEWWKSYIDLQNSLLILTVKGVLRQAYVYSELELNQFVWF